MKVTILHVSQEIDPKTGKQFITDMGSMDVNERTIHRAIALVRKDLETKGYEVRSIAPMVEGGLIAYMQDRKQAPKKKERKKPVTHEGPVGRGRKLPRRRRKKK